jgi:restriction system protein
MNWKQFEEFLANFFQSKGYTVTRLKHSYDMGSDLLLTKHEEIIIIQAKHRRHQPIGIKAIQEAYAAQGYYHTTHARVITTTRFTRSAQTLADTLRVECWDLHRLLRELYQDTIANKKK